VARERFLIAFRDATPLRASRISAIVRRGAAGGEKCATIGVNDDDRSRGPMQWRNSAERFGLPAQLLHWLTALFMLLAWLLGTFKDTLPRGAPREQALALHWSFGFLVLALACARAAWRAVDHLPPEVPGVAAWEHRVAGLAHLALYAIMVGLPLTGLFTAYAQNRAVTVLGLFTIPPLIGADRALARSIKDVHELLGNAMLVLVGLHAAAALRHHFILRDAVLRRMLPFAAAAPPPSPRQ
jgi:cytochrome b561